MSEAIRWRKGLLVMELRIIALVTDEARLVRKYKRVKFPKPMAAVHNSSLRFSLLVRSHLALEAPRYDHVLPMPRFVHACDLDDNVPSVWRCEGGSDGNFYCSLSPTALIILVISLLPPLALLVPPLLPPTVNPDRRPHSLLFDIAFPLL